MCPQTHIATTVCNAVAAGRAVQTPYEPRGPDTIWVHTALVLKLQTPCGCIMLLGPEAQTHYELLGCWDLEVQKPYEFIGFLDLEVQKTQEFIGFRDLEVQTPYEFIGFLNLEVQKPL